MTTQFEVNDLWEQLLARPHRTNRVSEKHHLPVETSLVDGQQLYEV